MNSRLSFDQAKEISIVQYLAESGIAPKWTRGNDHWYHSPFRSEKEPSFKVNSKLNRWYDHGIGEGGSIIDLGAKLHGCSPQEFVARLSEDNPVSSLHSQTPEFGKENKLHISSIRELNDPILLDYLTSRGISKETAGEFCQEIEFRIGRRTYSAVAFPNNSGGYELRNSWFKGSASPKDISFVDRGNQSLSIMEGFMDFLSILESSHPEFIKLSNDSNFLILNSVSFIKRSAPLMEAHKQINLILDNDSAGEAAKEKIGRLGIRFYDASQLYAEYKDVNEWLMRETENIEVPRKTRRRGLRR